MFQALYIVTRGESVPSRLPCTNFVAVTCLSSNMNHIIAAGFGVEIFLQLAADAVTVVKSDSTHESLSQLSVLHRGFGAQPCSTRAIAMPGRRNAS